MSCHYCRRWTRDVYGDAECAICRIPVCTEAREAYPGHGARCVGCSEVMCEAHVQEHAREHGAPAEECFPHFMLRHAVPAFFAAVRCAEAGRAPTPDEARELEHALNVVSPGHRALRGAVATLPLRHAHRDGTRWADANEEWVRLLPPVFTADVLSRAAALCLRSLALAVARLGGHLGGPCEPDVIPLHDRRRPRPDDGARQADGFAREAFTAVDAFLADPRSRLSGPVLELAGSLNGMEDPAALARWLLPPPD